MNFKEKLVIKSEVSGQHKTNDQLLTLYQLICLGIGMVIGGGIFVLTGIAAGNHAGPAVTLSFALAGIVCICVGFCYAEFSSIMNTTGSSYSYIYMSFGELPAFIIGFVTILGYYFGSITAISGFSGYFTDLLADFHIYLPRCLILSTRSLISHNNSCIHDFLDLPALVITLLSTCLLLTSIKTSLFMTSFLVISKILVLLIFIIVGSQYIDTNNFLPYIPPNLGEYGKFGISGIISGTTIVFLAFNGFDAVCTATQEAKKPSKDIPVAILVTIASVTIIYTSVAFVLTGIINYQELCVPQSFVLALKKIDIYWFNYVIKIGAIIGLCSVIITSLFTIIRMLLIISSDKLLPVFLTTTDKKNTPRNITLIVGLSMAIISSIFKSDAMIKFSSFLILISLISVCIATTFMRYKAPNIKRNFKCPLMPFIPMVGITVISYMLTYYSWKIYLSTFIMILLVIIYYFKQKFNREKMAPLN